jgi:hypothetical protein
MKEATRINGGASGLVTPDGRFLDPVTTGHGYMVSLSPTAKYEDFPWYGEAVIITPKGGTLRHTPRAEALERASALGELRTANDSLLLSSFLERMELIHLLSVNYSGHGLYVGMWQTNDLTCLDISLHAADKRFAKRLGRLGNQQAIFDIANMADINL